MSEPLPVSKRRTVPIAKLRTLIKLAQEFDLREFQVGDVRIVTRVKEVEQEKDDATKNMTNEQRMNYILFGDTNDHQ